jgi:hypothetical protein
MMKFRLLLIVSLVFTGIFSKAQENQYEGAAEISVNKGTYHGTFQPAAGDLELMPELKAVRAHINKSQNQEYLKKYKDSLRVLKRAAGLVPQNGSRKTTGTLDPVKVSGFNAHGNQGTPSDNTIAIGKEGKMIAAVNSSLRVYRSNGTTVQSIRSFPFFWSPITNKNDLCDPLVHYDVDFDRFIIFTQVCDRVTTDNRILVAFSETNDPEGSYHYYSFRANLREIKNGNYPVDVWFDYPKMGVSKSDLFITGNLFRNVSSTEASFVESAVFQIDKAGCFAGSQNPQSIIFSDIPGNPFTLVPASHGGDKNYGDKMYMCATRNASVSNSIRIYTVNGKVNASSTPSMISDLVAVPNYAQPADGVQQGTNVDLNTGDVRGMSAFFSGNTLQFVFHSNGPNNYSAINYNRFRRENGNWIVQNRLISIPNVDCAFPSIAWGGYGEWEQSAMLVFNYSSLNDFPGIGAIYVSHDMDASNPIVLRTGDSYASVGTSGGRTRWGDYTGISREHGTSIPTIWGFGMAGASTNGWRNYVSKIEVSALPLSTNKIDANESNKIEVYPNPVQDIYSVKLNIQESGDLEIATYDLQGRKVRDVLQGKVSKGESLFTFNKNGLANGTYFLRTSVNKKIISNEKIIIAK